MRQVEITVSQVLSKTFKILVGDGVDPCDAFKEQHWEVSSLLKILESYLISELHCQENRVHRLPKLLELIHSCKDWSLDNTSIVCEGEYKEEDLTHPNNEE